MCGPWGCAEADCSNSLLRTRRQTSPAALQNGWMRRVGRRTKMATVCLGSCLSSCLLFSRSPTPAHTVSECFRVHERTAQTRGQVSQMTPWRVCFCWNRDQGALVQGSTASMNLTVLSRPTTAHWRKLLTEGSLFLKIKFEHFSVVSKCFWEWFIEWMFAYEIEKKRWVEATRAVCC